jgi:hypothetical protein
LERARRDDDILLGYTKRIIFRIRLQWERSIKWWVYDKEIQDGVVKGVMMHDGIVTLESVE